MDRIDYETQVEIIVENACDELTAKEFEIFKKHIIEIANNYD